MSAKHTPGPWRIEGYTRLIGGEVTGHTISHGVNNYRDGPEGYVCTTNGTSEADARLIAAAPDLLEALQFAASSLDQLYRNIAEFGTVTDGEFLDGVYAAEQRCRAAIAKAEGAPQ